MAQRNSTTLHIGDLVQQEGVGALPVSRIEQQRFDRFWITLGDDPADAFIVDTRGRNRVPEEAGSAQPVSGDTKPLLQELVVHELDLIVLPEIGVRQIHYIEEPYPGRYQLILSQKYQRDIVLDLLAR